MAPLLAPLPANPPLPQPAAPTRAGGAPAAGPSLGGTGLMAAEASITGFELRTVPEGEVPAAPLPVVVPEPGSAALFGTGGLMLLWARWRRHAASGLDGEGGGR